MKQGLHPEYNAVSVRCACGNTFETRSTSNDIHVEICAVCHPYYTGRQKLIDTAGRVERFKQKWGDRTPAASKS
jgi:large subunit ribosomal protein L31